MQIKKTIRATTAAVIFSLLTFALVPLGAEVIDVSSEWKNALNRNKELKSQIFKLMGIDGDPDDYAVKSVKVPNGRMDAIGKDLTIPDREQSFITSTEVVNCEQYDVTQDVELTETYSNTRTLTKSHSFGTEFSSTVSGEFVLGEAEVTATASYNFSAEKADEESDEITFSRTSQINFSRRGGVVSVLSSLVLKSKNIPYMECAT